MLGCCSRDNPNAVEQRQNCCTQTMLTFAFITSLALLILGGLALAGVYNPTSVLGVLGNTFGFTGACVLMGVGGFFLIGDIFSCCAVNCRQPNAYSDRFSEYYY